ncbi:hypothetical protein [Chitinophaga sp. YIM B06452]|uniref:hypothetical protein n=1 Tax=Chitinophaga sp. YIM B06452 TaxID=3082158 RepID=UPI0031FEBC5E
MSKRKFIYLFIVVLILCVRNSAFSQFNKDIAPMSPAATTFSKFGDMPVNLHTGLPNISIPIYELEVDGFKLPIGIAYHAGGIKVDEGASHVGLGWALIAGGLINNVDRLSVFETVKVDGLRPDTIRNGKDGMGRDVKVNPDGTITYFSGKWPKRYVTAPGLNVKFEGTASSHKLFGPYTLARIDTLDQTNGFDFTNEDGIRYKFRGSEIAFAPETSADIINQLPANSFFYKEVAYNYDPKILRIIPERCNHLSEIRTLNNETISFSYAVSTIFNTGGFAESYFFPRNAVSPYLHMRSGGILPETQELDVYEPARDAYLSSRLSKITCSNGITIEFSYGEARKDVIGDNILAGIVVYHIDNGKKIVLKRVKFYQSYFESKVFEKRSTDPISNSIFYRLRLDSLDIDGGSIYEPQRYEFAYNSGELPERSSFSQDLWGYYNGAPNQVLINEHYDSAGLYGRRIYYKTPIVNRMSDSLLAQRGVLTKIVYPLGGSTSFEYESNTVSNDPYGSAFSYTGIPFAEAIMEYPIVPKTLPMDGAGTIREDLYKTVGPYYFTIRSENKINGRYGKLVRFDFEYLPGSTDAGPYEISVQNFTGDSSFIHPGGTIFYPNGIYRFFIKNTSANASWDWAKLRLVIKEPGFTNPVVMPAYNHRAGGIRIKRVVDYDGRDHLNDIVKNYKYHDLANPSRSSGVLTRMPLFLMDDHLETDIPKIVYREGGTAPLIPLPTTQMVVYEDFMFTNGQLKTIEKVAAVKDWGGAIGTIETPEFVEVAIMHQSFDIIKANSGYPSQEEFASYVGYSNVTVEYGDNGKHGRKEFVFTNTGAHWQRGQLISEQTYKKVGSTYTLIAQDSLLYAIDTAWLRPVMSFHKTLGTNPSSTFVESTSWMGYDVPLLQKPTWSKTLNSTNDTIISINKFPGVLNNITGTDNFSMGVRNLKKLNIQSIPLEQSVFTKSAGGAQKLLSSTLSSFRPSSPQVDTVYAIDNAVPLSSFNGLDVAGGKAVKDPQYVAKQVAGKYTSKGRLAEVYQVGHNAKAYLWDYKGQYPVAIVENADSLSIAYTSFETSNYGNWEPNSSQIDNLNALTGRKSFVLQSGKSICRNNLPAANTYIVSYWSRNGALTVPGQLQLTHTGSNGWTYYEHLLPASTSNVCLTGNNVTIDELRLFPVNAQMTTQTFDDFIGVTSQCLPSGRLVYYRYDPLGRLQLKLDAEGNVLEVYENNIKKNIGL